MKSYTWNGLEHRSLETCTVTPKDEGYFVASQISYDPTDPDAADVVYEMHLSADWKVERLLIQSSIGDKPLVGCINARPIAGETRTATLSRSVT